MLDMEKLDIYFKKDYAKLHENMYGGEAISYKYESLDGTILYNFIKREIKQEIDGVQYYDIITPYGYGGPLVLNCRNKEKLIESYLKEFADYCDEKNIVSEFIRYHPIFENQEYFLSSYDVRFDRYTLGTNLTLKDCIENELSKSAKRIIRKGLKEGLTYRIIQGKIDVETFMNIYYSTMNRDNASDFYYFNKKYFDDLNNNLSDNILYVEILLNKNIVAAAICFISSDIIHVHLSGTLPEYLKLSPAYILRYAEIQWGLENNYKFVHHGGGKTACEADNLYKFKERFSQNTKFKFYTGRKIWNHEIYERLCTCSKQVLDKVPGTDFFPKYRIK